MEFFKTAFIQRNTYSGAFFALWASWSIFPSWSWSALIAFAALVSVRAGWALLSGHTGRTWKSAGTFHSLDACEMIEYMNKTIRENVLVTKRLTSHSLQSSFSGLAGRTRRARKSNATRSTSGAGWTLITGNTSLAFRSSNSSVALKQSDQLPISHF